MDTGVEGATAPAVEEISRHAIVLEPGAVLSNFIRGNFCCQDFSTDVSSVAIIACVGARALVAFPGECWAKKVTERKLPQGCIEKAIQLRVPGCGVDRDQPLDNCSVNVWIGWLRAGLEKYIEFGSPNLEPSFGFLSREAADPCFPMAQALVDAAHEKFNLMDLLNPTPIVANMESRFESLQAGLNELLAAARDRGDGGFVSAQEQVHETQRPVTKLRLRPPGAREAEGQQEQKSQMGPPPGLTSAFEFPSAVAAARQAGIPDNQLKKMSQVLTVQPTRLEDYPRPGRAEPDGLFDADGEDRDFNQAAEEEVGGDPMSMALLKLTSIVSSLSKRKDNHPDDIVDGVASGVSGSADSGSNLGRKHAVVRERACTGCSATSPRRSGRR